MSKLHQKFLNRRLIVAAMALLALSAGLYGCFSGRDRLDGGKPIALQSIPGTGFTIYAAGDIADCKKFKPADTAAEKTATLVARGLAGNPNAAVLVLGDLAYPVGLPIEFANCYDPTWGRFKERTYPSPGNHEYYTPGAVGYFRYFGEQTGPERRGYFSVNLGTWHVISLNSNLKDDALATQLAWLKADLAQNKARCTLAYWHHPLFSSGGHGNNEVMKSAWQALHAAGADVVLSSHDHDYERFAPQDAAGTQDNLRGIREFVVGTGGAKLTPFGFPKTNSELGDNGSYGVLKMVLKDSGYEWEFLSVDADGFTDRGAALCH